MILKIWKRGKLDFSIIVISRRVYYEVRFRAAHLDWHPIINAIGEWVSNQCLKIYIIKGLTVHIDCYILHPNWEVAIGVVKPWCCAIITHSLSFGPSWIGSWPIYACIVYTTCYAHIRIKSLKDHWLNLLDPKVFSFIACDRYGWRYRINYSNLYIYSYLYIYAL